jgi:hypothetical protein
MEMLRARKMELVGKNSEYLILAEKKIARSRFVKTEADMYFSNMVLHYDGIELILRISLSPSFMESSQKVIEEEPFYVRKTDKNNISFLCELAKKDLSNPSHTEIKVVKIKIVRKNIIVKLIVRVPPSQMEKKRRSMTRTEWLLTHPLQGGGFTPR